MICIILFLEIWLSVEKIKTSDKLLQDFYAKKIETQSGK